ncbi:uncharacterized protein WM294_015665 [Sarcoramphus papa]
MLTVEWTQASGWGRPRIRPFQDLRLHPAASALHYAVELFEGMKAFRGADDKIRLFRPELNMERMERSAERVCLPAFDGAELLECIRALGPSRTETSSHPPPPPPPAPPPPPSPPPHSVDPPSSSSSSSTSRRGSSPPSGGRYLLIDNQGLPYTVLVAEPGGPGALRRAFSCPVCGRSFEYLSYLQRHSITHSEHKPHVCRACGKAFKRTSHLERHKYTHAGRKPHACPLCPRRFRDSGELAHHQRVHTGERPFQCPHCHMRFGERNTLQRHVRRKHLPRPPAP